MEREQEWPTRIGTKWG